MAVIIIIGGGGGREAINAATTFAEKIQAIDDKFQSLYNKGVVSDEDVDLAKELAVRLKEMAIELNELTTEAIETIAGIERRCAGKHGHSKHDE